MFNSPQVFWLRAKFSTHVIINADAKIELSCSNYFKLLTVVVVKLATALKQVTFSSHLNKIINLILLISITSIFDCPLASMKYVFFQGLTEILLNNGTQFYIK